MQFYSVLEELFFLGAFAAGVCGLAISCYELIHHEQLSGFLKTKEHRIGAMSVLASIFVGALATFGLGLGTSDLNPGNYIGKTGYSMTNAASRCLNGMENCVGSKFGGLCPSICSSSFGRIGAYLPNLQSMPKLPSLPSIPYMNYMPGLSSFSLGMGNSVLGSTMSGFFPMLALFGALVYGGVLHLQCSGTARCA